MRFRSMEVKFFFIVNLLLLFGCKNESKEGLNLTSVKDINKMSSRYIAGRPMNLFPVNHYVSASNLMLLDSILVIHRSVPFPHYFEAYNVNTMQKIGFFGIQGNGPNELPDSGLSSLNNRSSKNLGLIIQNEGGRYYEFDLNQFLIDTEGVNWEPLSRFGYGDANTFVKIADTLFAMLSLSAEERLTLIGLSGEKIGGFFDYPFESEFAEFPKDLLGMLHQGLLVKNDILGRLAIFNFDSVCWEIIDFKNPLKLERIAKTHLSKPNAFDASRRLSETSVSKSVSFADTNPVAFLDVETSNNMIFALYGGRNYKENGSDAFFANQVLVLDWNGNVIDKIELDKDTNCIVVNETGTLLYSVVESNGKDDIYEYKLN